MSAARGEILSRIRAALDGVAPDPLPVVAPRTAEPADIVARFAERVADYRATVVHCAADEIGTAVAAALPDGARVVVPPGLPEDVRAGLAGLTNARVDDQLSAAELDQLDVVVTCCWVAVAETGTIVLDHAPDQGRRAITLVPDRHICVVRAYQVVTDVPDALAAVDPVRPLTWISGPSATSDIELDRVEGVHGPRNLHVIVAGLGARASA